MANTKTEDQRNQLFTLRLSPDERERLEAVAKANGTGAATVIRDAVNAACDAKGIEHVFRERAGA